MQSDGTIAEHARAQATGAGQLERLTLGQALFESGFYQRADRPLAQVYRGGQQNFTPVS